MTDKRQVYAHALRAWADEDQLRHILVIYRKADEPTRRGVLERCWIRWTVEKRLSEEREQRH